MGHVSTEGSKDLDGVLLGVEEGIGGDVGFFVGGEEAILVFDIENHPLLFGFGLEVAKRELVECLLIHADRKRGINVVGGDVGHDFLANSVEGADNGNSVVGGGSHGKIGHVAFSLAVVLFVPFHVDDMRDVRRFEPLVSLFVVVAL